MRRQDAASWTSLPQPPSSASLLARSCSNNYILWGIAKEFLFASIDYECLTYHGRLLDLVCGRVSLVMLRRGVESAIKWIQPLH